MRDYDKEAELKRLVEDLKSDPQSESYIIAFRHFMVNLEREMISDEVLEEQLDILMPVNPHLAFKLLNFAKRQKINRGAPPLHL